MFFNDLRRDIAYGIRSLTRTPGFSTVAILTLALGIGAVTIIYSVVRNVVLDPFPYVHSDRLVNLVVRDASNRIVRGPYFPASEFLDIQEQSQVFDDVVGTSVESMHWVHEGGADRLSVGWMTPNGFSFLGVPPLAGRVFGAADAAPDAPPVGVLNHRAWMTLFGGDPSVVGRTIVLNDQPRTIVGIMPPRFEWNIADVWIPAPMRRTDEPGSTRGTRAFQAHLRPGITIKEAEKQLEVVATRLAATYPREYPGRFRIELISVIDWVVREFRGVLYTLFGAVSLLLLISCCNVANMLLARATAREREISIRAAIGASRGRIVRQLLVESALLASAGLAAGCLMAYGGIMALAAFMPRQGVPWETQVRLDRPVLAFAAIAAAIATLAFGVFPAFQSARRDLMAGAGLGGRGTAGRRQTRLRGSLVVAQVAFSIVLLLGAGLLMRTFVKLVTVDFGFNPSNLLVAGVSFPPKQNASVSDQARFYRDALTRLSGTPGVTSVAISNGVPPFGGMVTAVQLPGGEMSPQPTTMLAFGSERLFETIGVPFLRGAAFTALDVGQSRHVAVVNETFAKKYFGSDDALGRSVRLARLSTLPVPVADPTVEIVGVIRDVRNQGPCEAPMPHVFVPFTLRGPAALALAIRTTSDPRPFVNVVRREIQALDPHVAIADPITIDDLIQRAFYARPRFSLLILGIFAVAGIVLVAFGVYGVLAYTVSQQSREIAIRMALGGARGDVVRMVLRAGLRLVAAGLAVGLAAGLATNRLLVGQLWNTSPHDPMTLLVAIAVVVIIGVCACWVPARRAVRVEPMVALRHD